MKVLDADALHRLSARAAALPRQRANLNLHPSLDDPVQRLCNALEPGTYVRPHRHPQPDRWELFAILTGAAAVLQLDASGRVLTRVELRAGGPGLVVEIPAGAWHTLVALAPGTVLFELKPGPYTPLADKDFAAWAPPESGAGAAELVAWFAGARPGEAPPQLSAGARS